jgi:hypothetical protein
MTGLNRGVRVEHLGEQIELYVRVCTFTRTLTGGRAEPSIQRGA